MLDAWKRWARDLQVEVYTLYLACRDPRVSWYAKTLAAGVVAYAFSPIDLIPDPIPVLGYLDDLVLLPLGILAVRRMIPPAVLAECRARAHGVMAEEKPVNWIAAAVIVAIWIATAAIVGMWTMRRLRSN